MKRILNKKICLVMALLAFTMMISGCGKTKVPEETAPPVTAPARQLKENLQTILVMVSDDYDISDTSGSYRNGKCIDFFLLMVVDEATAKVTTLQLNPDTVVPFSVPGKSETIQIPLGQVYSYGSGGSDSYINVNKAVSSFLENAPIDHYLVFTLESVGIVSNMLGGVPVSESAEIPAQILQGTEAMTYFETREANDVSNAEHMQRQRQFMMAMYQPFMASAQDDDFLTKLTLQLGDGMATDLTLSQMLQMFETLAAYQMEESVHTIQGDAELVDGEYRFHTDEASLEPVLSLLFVR